MTIKSKFKYQIQVKSKTFDGSLLTKRCFKHCHWLITCNTFSYFLKHLFLKNVSLTNATSLFCSMHSEVAYFCFCQDFLFKVCRKSFDLKIGPHPPHLAPFTHSWIYSKPLQNKIIKTSDATTPAIALRRKICQHFIISIFHNRWLTQNRVFIS